MNPKAKDVLRPGNELRITLGEKDIWVTVIRFEEDKIFVKAEGEDEKYLQDLYVKS